MKIAVIGGAGVRTPLLVAGLTGSDLPIHEIALYDLDRPRLDVIAALAGRMAARGRVTTSPSAAECVRSADFVFTSIRVGGIEQRANDEAIVQRHGVVGQETVGPVGFAMAMRTIPPMVAYARAIAQAAPRAWIINFTNPVGMITEAMRSASDRVIGICDTPTDLFEHTARALALDPRLCDFEYFGLNHLGWLREVYFGGAPQLDRLWQDARRLASVYRMPLFEPAVLRGSRLLPTEYVYYYTQPARAFENIRRAAQNRGQAIAELTHVLFDTLRDGVTADPVAAYTAYLRTRSAGYMQIESGADAPVFPTTTPELSGYDKIALSVVRAIHFNMNAIIPLSVRNGGTIPELRDDDVVEVPCVVNANGARPLHVGPVPDAVRPLLTHVKEYERRTISAASSPGIDAARDALASNPLVPSPEVAARLVAALSPLW